MKNLKNFLKYPFILLGIFSLLLLGCTKEKDDNSSSDDLQGKPVTISGTMSASALQVTGVLALSSNNKFKKVAVTNQQFSIELDNGKPWGLVFLNAAEQPLGILSLGNGIESLPLQNINSSYTKINLDTISLDGTIFTPKHNPIGSEISLTAEQIQIIAGMDDYLVALMKNPDVNGNGKIDVLEGKLFSLSVIYFIKPGNFHVPALTPTLDPTKLIEGYRLFLTVRDASYPETIYYTGPAGSPLHNTASESYLATNDSRVYSTYYLQDLSGIASFIPPGGIYTINYGSSTLTFNLSDQSYVNTNIVFPWPTVTLNDNGTLNKVDWTYMIPAGAASFDVSALLRDIMVQLGGVGPACTAIPNQSGLYGSDRLAITPATHTFACKDIVWGNTPPQPGNQYVEQLMMTYEDHYGSSYVVMYGKSY
jgi:hypothetical protein